MAMARGSVLMRMQLFTMVLAYTVGGGLLLRSLTSNQKYVTMWSQAMIVCKRTSDMIPVSNHLQEMNRHYIPYRASIPYGESECLASCWPDSDSKVFGFETVRLLVVIDRCTCSQPAAKRTVHHTSPFMTRTVVLHERAEL